MSGAAMDSQERRHRFLLIGMPAWDVRTPLHSLAHVASIVSEAGWQCKVVDLNVAVYNILSETDRSQWNDAVLWQTNEAYVRTLFDKCRASIEARFASLLNEGPWDLVGFSVKSTTKYFTLLTAKLLDEMSPDVPILFGGPDCFPREFSTGYYDNSIFSPDIMLQGEAEVALPSFLGEYETTRSIETKIPGFVYRSSAQLEDNGEPALPNLLQSDLIADYSQFAFAEYSKPIYVSTFLSRGCISKCAFCSETNNFRNFRTRTVNVVLREIEEALEYMLPFRDPPYFHFADSMLNAHRKRLEEFCDLVIESDVRFEWGAPVGFRMSFDKSLAEKMKKAGCRYLFWGFESASQQVLDLMDKEVQMEDVYRTLAMLREVGMNSELGITVGFPGETSADIISTIKFVLRYRDQPLVKFPYVQPILVDGDSLLKTRPADYGLANTRVMDWETTDGRNTEGVRLFRWFVVSNAVFNPDLSTEKSVGLEGLSGIDFNALALASDMASLIYELGKETDRELDLTQFLENWDGKPVREVSSDDLLYWHPENVPAAVSLSRWFSLDKNDGKARRRIHELVLHAVRELAGSCAPVLTT